MPRVVYIMGGLGVAAVLYLLTGYATVHRLRSEEVQLHRMIDEAALPDFQLVERSTIEPASDLLNSWHYHHIPLINQLTRGLSAPYAEVTYTTDASPTQVYADYAARYNPTEAWAWQSECYLFTVEESGTLLEVDIASEAVPLGIELSAVRYPIRPAPERDPNQKTQVKITARPLPPPAAPTATSGYPWP